MYQVLSAYFIGFRRLVGVAAVACTLLFAGWQTVSAQDEDEQLDAIAIFNEAQGLHEKGDLNGALKLYDKALRTLPEFPEAEFQRGMALIALGRSDEAEVAYRRAIELRPDWTLAMTGLGSLLVNRGKFSEAEPVLRKVLAIDPQNPPAVAALAEVRLQAKAPEAELRALLATLTNMTAKANPTTSLWVTRAALEHALGNNTLAKLSLTKALQLDPRNRSALFQRGEIAIAENDSVHAREILGQLENDAAASDSVKLIRANVLALEGKFDDALAELDAIKRLPPSAHDLRTRIIAVKSTDPVALEKQLADDPKKAVVLGRLCSLYRRDDPNKALTYCRRASEAEPNNISHAIGFGAALIQAKQFDGAAGLLTKLVGLAPDNSTARANLATALFQLKRSAEAKEQFTWLTTNNPSSAGAYFFLGIIHDELTEYMDAAANYQSYLKHADPVNNAVDIEKVKLRLPAVEKFIKEGKGKKK